jgi:DNA primase
MGITAKTKEAIKAAPLSAVIEAAGGSLKRVGHEFVTECLWHDDSNPSLTVSDQKGFCFCHVCRASEDAIGYVQKKKGMSFPDAAEFSAAVLGIQVEYENVDPEKERQRREARARTINKLKSEQDSYKEKLRDPRAGRIRDILKDRGLTAAASKEFGLGFSPLGQFSGRITIPIYNHRNELVGWTGRATQEGQKPKYKNSSESDLFIKKQLVFNEYRAMEAAREAGHVIFVEGHLDVVAMWQAGIKNVVAMQGTAAPDPSVLTRLARSAKTFVLCYDGDAGGRKAVEQFISVGGPMAMEGKININVANLPEGQDPDEVIRSGGDLYGYIASAPSWLDWIIDSWVFHLDHSDGAMITEVESRLKKLINGLQSKALRTHYIDKVSRALSENSKEAEKLAKDWEQNRIEVSRLTWKPREPEQIRLAAEKRMIRIFVHRPEKRDLLRPWLDRVGNPALRWLCERLRELEDHSTVDLTPHSLMAVVAVAEPHYIQQVRTLIRPNVIIDDSQGVIDHISDIMCLQTATELDEFDPHQPF